MKSIEIKFKTPEDTTEFINICSSFISDINIYDGSIAVDAKSIVSVFAISQSKVIRVEMISEDKDEINRFIDKIRKFEV